MFQRFKDTIKLLQLPSSLTLTLLFKSFKLRLFHVFLLSGTPLNRLQHFRSLLEENALCLSDRRQMATIIPHVLEKEKSSIKEISGKHLFLMGLLD